MNNNLLGVAYEDQREKDHNKKHKEAPIGKLVELLTQSKSLEVIDLSYNFIEQKSIFCLAHGMKFA